MKKKLPIKPNPKTPMEVTDLARKFKRERNMARLSIVTIALGALLTFTFFIVAMYRMNLIDLPPYLADIIGMGGADGNSSTPGLDERVVEALQDRNTPDSYTVEYNVEAADLLALFEQSSSIPTYSLVNTVTYYSGETSLSYRHQIWRDGQSYRVRTYMEATLLRDVTCNGYMVYITEHDGENSSISRYFVSDSFTMENQTGIPSAEEVRRRVAEAESPDIQLLRRTDNSVYRIRFTDPDIPDMTEELYVSIEYGLVLRAETRIGGELVYSVATASVSDTLTGYEDDVNLLFIAPHT